MSTATADPTSPAKTDAPVDMAKLLYGSASKSSAVQPVESQPTSTPTAENGTATPPQEIVAPAAEAKPDPAKEVQAEQAKAEAEKAKVEESHRQAARKLGKKVQDLETVNAQLAEEIRVLKAKAEGTYEEPQGPTPEQLQAMATFQGRELASLEVAVQKYGQDKVQERIYAPDSEFRQFLAQQKSEQKTWAERRISESLQPTIEAWTILEENAFKEKYGNDPSQWVQKIIADAKPALLEEFKKTITTPIVGNPAPSVTQARGDGGPQARKKSLAELMYGKPASPA